MTDYQELRESIAAVPDAYRSEKHGWEVYSEKGHHGVQVPSAAHPAASMGNGYPVRVTHAQADWEGFGNGSIREVASYQATADPDTIERLLADHDRYLAALQALDALDPDDFKSHESHLAPAFQQPDIKAAFRRVVQIVNGTLHGMDEYGDPLPVDGTYTAVEPTKLVDIPELMEIAEEQKARYWECVLVPRLANEDLGLQCYETDPDTDPAIHGDCGWRER